MTNSIRATFVSLRSATGTTTLQCRETGTRYSFTAREGVSFPVWREGEIACHRVSLNGALAFIESDSRWQLREELREQKALATRWSQQSSYGA